MCVKNTQRIWYGLFGLLLLATTAAAQPEAEVEPLALLQTPPDTLDGIEQRVALAAARLEALAPTTQPAEAADALGGQRNTLYAAWQQYREQLLALRDRLQALESANSEQQQQARAVRLAELKAELQRTQQLNARGLSDERRAELRQRLAEVTAQAEAVADEQARRTQLTGGGAVTRRSEREQQLRALRQELADLRRTADRQTTTQPAESELIPLKRRTLQVGIATLDVRLARLKVEEQLATLLFAQEQSLLETLQALRAALEKLLERTAQVAARDRLATLREQLAAAQDPLHRALLELDIFVERVGLESLPPLARLRPERRQELTRLLEEVRGRLAGIEERWRPFVAPAPGAEAQAGKPAREQIEIRDELVEQQAPRLRWVLADNTRTLRLRRAELVPYETGLSERLQELQSLRGRAFAAFNEQRVGILELLDTAEQEELRTAARQKIDTLRGELRNKFDESKADLQGLLDEVQNHIAHIDELLGILDAIGQRLYWERIGRRDSGVLRTDWRRVWNDTTAIWAGLSGWGAGTAAGEFLSLQRDTRRDAAALRQDIDATFGRIRPRNLWWLLATMLVAVLVGATAYRGARHRGRRLAREIEAGVPEAESEESSELTAGLSARINLLILNMIGDLAIPAAATGVLVGGAVWLIDAAVVQALVLTLIGLVFAALALTRFVHHIFEAYSPPHRPIPCSDRVAQHYRYWLVSLIAVSVIMLLPPALLRVADLAPAAQNGFVESYKALALAMLLFFLAPRSRVLGEADTRGWLAATLALLHPVLLLGVLALFALQFAGYGALVTFITIGVLGTLVALLLCGFAAEYVVDSVDQMLAHAEPSAEVETTARRPRYLRSMLKALSRLAALFAAIAAIVWVWRISVPAEWYDWDKIGLAALIVVTGLVAERVLTAALFTFERTGRLPESVVFLMRRWMRVLVAVLVGLGLLAVIGWQIGNLWTIISTLLAMIAIGFVAVWSVLSNLLATLIVLIWRPFNLGEEIRIDPEGIEGRVVDISFMFTVLKAEDGTMISVPNSFFVQKFTHRKPTRRRPVRSLAEQLERDKPLE